MKFSSVLLLVILAITASSVKAYPNKQFLQKLVRSVDNASCIGKCKQGYVPEEECQCNPLCSQHGNCCSDYVQVCVSCVNRCGVSADQSYGCQCNTVCANYNDCCEDYESECTGTQKPEVTDTDLIAISEKIGSLDINNVGTEIVINVQGKSTGCTNDVAPSKLITSVNEENVLSKDTFKAFATLMDNYKPDVKIVEDRTEAEREEESLFLDIILETPVMKAAYEFMTQKELFVGSVAQFKTLLTEIWFGLYDRDGTSKDVMGSSGFEHVFIGEYRDNGVQGFHNWYSFYLQEKQGDINYYGYIDHTDFGTANGKGVSGVFTWNSMAKCYGSMTVGTSPELEMALYTICFYARPEAKCKMSINNVPLLIQTFPLIYKSKTYVGTSYCDWN